jgi:ParB-like chromosome segregation protein Spo0J
MAASFQMRQWHLEKRLIKELKPHHKNPRQLSKVQERHLSASIDKFGLAEKIIINTDNTIIGGHQRIQILKMKKIKEVECWVPDVTLDERDVDEMNIRLNKNTGDWDYDILANEWEVPDLLNWGFSAEDLQIGEAEAEDEDIDEDESQEKCEACGQKIKKKT